MIYKKHFYILFICFFLSIFLNGQSIPYILDDSPKKFAALELQLQEEAFNSVIKACSKILEKEQDYLIKGIAHFYIGQSMDMMDNMGEAIENYQQAIDYFDTIKFEKGLSAVYLKHADLYFFRQLHQDAEPFYQLAIDFAEKLGINDILAEAYQKRALIFTATQNSAEAINDLKKALDIAILSKDSTTCNFILNQISTNYHASGQLDSAIVYFKKALDLKNEMEDPEGLISDYSSLGNLYRERGDYEMAIRQFAEALSIAENEADTFSIMTIYIELGKIYTDQLEDWPVAENYFNQALLMAKKKNISFTIANCNDRLGLVLQKQKLDDLAVEKYEIALEIFNRLNNKTGAAEVLLKLCTIYNNKDHYEKAKVLLEEALLLRNDREDKPGKLAIKLVLSEIEINYGDPKKGLNYALQCLPLYESMNDSLNLKNLYFLLAKGYEKQKDFKKALSYYKKYDTINKDLISIEKAEAIKEFDLLVTKERNQKEMAKKNEQLQANEMKLLRKNNQLLILGAGAVLLVMLAGFLFFAFQKNKQINAQRINMMKKEQETQRLKAVIEGEEKERNRLARELHDGLGTVLATVKMQISGIPHKLPQVESLSTYQKAESLIDNACRTIREISHDLMPYVLEQQGLIFAIDDMCQNFANQSDIEFEFIPFGNEDRLDDVLKITTFRITQELLKNTIKHAQAKEVIVQLSIENEEIILIVEDNGKGFDVSTPSKGIGLENIRSRTAYLNGTLEIDSQIGKGSTFMIQLPLDLK